MISQKYVDNQYAAGCTPATVCKCLAFDSLSATIKVANDPAMKGNDSTSKNQAENAFEALERMKENGHDELELIKKMRAVAVAITNNVYSQLVFFLIFCYGQRPD